MLEICRQNMQEVFLKAGKEHSALRGHPWIFSGAIANSKGLQNGDQVNVFSANSNFIASGHWSDGSIAIRILSREPIENRQDFWNAKIAECLQIRKSMGFPSEKETDAFRLIHGEGDGLPGLICDIYGKHAVVQAHSMGMYLEIETIAAALDASIPGLETIYCKSKAALHAPTIEDRFLKGSAEGTLAYEYGMQFHVNWVEGQKTGFFLDQRENRKLLREKSAGKTVLNTFSYTGGFSVAALLGNAEKVVSADVSSKAIALCNENVSLLSDLASKHEGVVEDVLKYLKEQEELWDIVILDPPAFAKNLSKKHAAVMGYKRLNTLGMSRVKKGGLLFTFSCSQVIDTELFTHTVTAAGIESGRNARILYRLGQGPDHPVNLFHPEGHYLKGLVLQLD
jgi:23S rRNA (cytosine1962-C5)-methyltransferase